MNLDHGWLDEAEEWGGWRRAHDTCNGCRCTFGWYSEDSAFRVILIPGCPVHDPEVVADAQGCSYMEGETE
jgi:hypothetical protein